MGRFFNKHIMNIGNLPKERTPDGRIKVKSLEVERKEWNARIMGRKETKEEGIIHTDDGNKGETKPDVLPPKDEQGAIRPVRKKRTRKARSDKGKRHSKNSRQS